MLQLAIDKLFWHEDYLISQSQLDISTILTFRCVSLLHHNHFVHESADVACHPHLMVDSLIIFINILICKGQHWCNLMMLIVIVIVFFLCDKDHGAKKLAKSVSERFNSAAMDTSLIAKCIFMQT